MRKKTLHITNGNALTDYLQALNFKGTILTWQEMLCEGPTIAKIDSKAFYNLRIEFLKNTYGFEVNEDELKQELSKLNNTKDYDEINLWFEYDLFCHINLLGVINLLHQKEINKPLYLICSGRVKGEKQLKGLGELTEDQLIAHYNNKILLTKDDINLAIALWRTYCDKDHNIFKNYITKPSNFKYLGICLKAHLRRFPHQHNGLNMLEENILKLIDKYTIKSKHHLLGYALNYQGYYGFGDTQINRIINKLAAFYTETEKGITLNRKGHEVLLSQKKYNKTLQNNMVFGGVKMNDFNFSKTENKLIKTAANAN